MYFSHWINVHLGQPEVPLSQITETHARWMFVLLSRIEDFISADDTSLLRNLARACLGLLKKSKRDTANTNGKTAIGDKIEKHTMSARSCWIIITVVASVWGQRDLWIDAESMLSEDICESS